MTSRAYHLRRKYGITEVQYESLLETQNGRCGVCGRSANDFKSRLAVDHDHKTGAIRGLLCLYCNRYIIGRHRRESGADLLRKGHEYLDREYTEWLVPKRKKRKRKRKSK